MSVLCARCMADGSNALRDAMLAVRPEPLPTPRIAVRGLLDHASRLTGFPAAEIVSKARRTPLARVRKAVAFVAVQQGCYSLEQIGKTMGGRDHATVSHARTAAEILIEREPEFVWLVERLWAAADCEPMGPEAGPVSDESAPPAQRRRAAKAATKADKPDRQTLREELTTAQIVRGSRALLSALRREFPERVAVWPELVTRPAGKRAGCTLAAA